MTNSTPLKRWWWRSVVIFQSEKPARGLEIRDKMIMSPNVILDPQHGIRESFINGRWRWNQKLFPSSSSSLILCALSLPEQLFELFSSLRLEPRKKFFSLFYLRNEKQNFVRHYYCECHNDDFPSSFHFNWHCTFSSRSSPFSRKSFSCSIPMLCMMEKKSIVLWGDFECSFVERKWKIFLDSFALRGFLFIITWVTSRCDIYCYLKLSNELSRQILLFRNDKIIYRVP